MASQYMNRELSWLKFNERVLEEAEDKSVPLCERFTFVSIYQTNLDEFFMVRVGSLYDQTLLPQEIRDNKTKTQPLYGLLVQGISSGRKSAGVIICHSHRQLF